MHRKGVEKAFWLPLTRLTRLENFLSKRDPFLFPSTVADLGGGSHLPPWPKRNPPKSRLPVISPLEWPNPQPLHQNRRRLIPLQPSNQKPNLTPHWPEPRLCRLRPPRLPRKTLNLSWPRKPKQRLLKP